MRIARHPWAPLLLLALTLAVLPAWADALEVSASSPPAETVPDASSAGEAARGVREESGARDGLAGSGPTASDVTMLADAASGTREGALVLPTPSSRMPGPRHPVLVGLLGLPGALVFAPLYAGSALLGMYGLLAGGLLGDVQTALAYGALLVPGAGPFLSVEVLRHIGPPPDASQVSFFLQAGRWQLVGLGALVAGAALGWGLGELLPPSTVALLPGAGTAPVGLTLHLRWP